MRLLPLCALILLAGCGGSEPETRTTSGTPPTATPVQDVCARFIPKKALAQPKGLLVPPGKITIGKVTNVPPQLRLEGYIDQGPLEVRKYFESTKKVKVVFAEDEGREAEMLITNGRHRNFWKVLRACDRGSVFAVIVVREEDAR